LCFASEVLPLKFDMGKHFDLPGIIPLFLAMDKEPIQRECRRGAFLWCFSVSR
jgi:hypothetical protein